MSFWSPEAIKQRLERWLAAGGAKALYETQRRADAERKRIQDTLRVDHSTLDKPMTM